MNIAIRLATAADAELLSLVGQATFLESYAHMIDGADILAHCKRQHAPAVYDDWLADRSARIWIAQTDPGAAPVGYLVMRPPELPIETRSDDVEIKRIYVLHRFHGAGVGARLMSVALDEARAMNMRRVLLGVYRGNEGAIAFYTRMGFDRCGTRKFRVGAREYDDLVLARSI